MSKTLRRFILSTASLALIGVFGLACAPAAEAPQKPVDGATAVKETPKRGGVLTTAYNRNPVGFDPHKTISDPTMTRINRIYSRLLRFRTGPEWAPGDYTPESDLAESWNQPDDLTFVFQLRKGVKFHNKPPVNGREVTSADVKYSLERMQKLSASKYLLEKIKSIETPDKYSVKITLSEPYVPILNNLANHTALILAKEVEDQFGDFTKPETAIGTGPFMLKEQQDDVKTEYVRNPDFFIKGVDGQSLPYIDGNLELILTDPSTMIAALRSGQLDIAGSGTVGVTNEDVKSFKATGTNLVFFENLGVGMCFTGFRVDQKPFDDVRVRRAISLAVNRKEWLNTIYEAKGAWFNGPIPAAMAPWFIGYDNLGKDVAQWLDFDLTKAKQLLTDAGYPNGFKTLFQHSAYYGPARVQQLEIVRDYIAKIGIQADLDLKEYAAFIASGYAGIFDGMVYVCESPFYEPDEYLYGQFYSKEARNHSRVNDPKLDKMLEDQRKIKDPAERKKLIDEIQRYLISQAYNVQTPQGVGNSAWQPWLKGYKPKGGYDRGTLLSLVWLDKK